ncbi:LysR family transcriptional regulator [Labrenzia sp. OB1]|uniref:LysR family transcriptional regulator n=1 Tax=Labrenzia sp. OB1 TaxID=1561204 RepID=UPI0007B269E3|nr:LysR family transcriptional regulator [Labrenzia sp. OB1]KZM47838.1 hypothetical protein OA90_23935 [Labrenzia sp. OB1]
MIEVTPLRYFVSAFELGTISAAAAAHGIAQPSLSQALHKLEENIAAPLFVRTRKGLRPTTQGSRLYQHALSILGAVQNAEDSFRPLAQRHASFYTSPDILLKPFRGAFQGLKRACPELELRFETNAADAELALVDQACAPKSHRFHELIREPYVLALNKGHPLAAMRVLDLGELHAVPLIARRYCPRYDALLAELAREELTLTSSAEAVHDQQVLELVRLGFGGALLPAGHVARHEAIAAIAIAIDHPFLSERRVGLAVKKTAAANEVFRIWMTGFNAPSP